MNFARDVVEAAPAEGRALLDLSDGARRAWSFGEVAAAAASLAGEIERRGVGRGDVVMTLIGNRSEWVLTMLACFRIGAVVLPCTEQLRSEDLALRLRVAAPKLVVAHRRNVPTLEAAAPACPVLRVPDAALLTGSPAAVAELSPTDPCLMTFTSGTSGPTKAVVHGQRYLSGQALQAVEWLGARRGDLVWCTAASGWSKSMPSSASTSSVARGSTSSARRRRPPRRAGSPGLDGTALPGVRAWVEDGELVVDAAMVPTSFLGYLGEAPGGRPGAWRTGDRVREDGDGFLFFEGRTDDLIISSGYRIGPAEIESVLIQHPAVADVAVVGAPGPDRGSVVKAFVVLAEGVQAGPSLAAALQAFARERTAPYKYPRQVEVVDELPRTSSGKVRRAALRERSA